MRCKKGDILENWRYYLNINRYERANCDNANPCAKYVLFYTFNFSLCFLLSLVNRLLAIPISVTSRITFWQAQVNTGYIIYSFIHSFIYLFIYLSLANVTLWIQNFFIYLFILYHFFWWGASVSNSMERLVNKFSRNFQDRWDIHHLPILGISSCKLMCKFDRMQNSLFLSYKYKSILTFDICYNLN